MFVMVARQMDMRITAWKIESFLERTEKELPTYKPGKITQDFMRDLVRLSYLDNGPALAEEYFAKKRNPFGC